MNFEERLENYRAQEPRRKCVTPRQSRRLRQKAWKAGELPRARAFREKGR
jgi:hypothetical protein